MLTEMFIGFITDKTVHFVTLLYYIFFLFILFTAKGIAVLSDKLQEKINKGKEEQTGCY